jgi:hypothetical protein
VTSNLAIIKNTLGADHLIFMNQSHGNGIFVFRPGHRDKKVETPSAEVVPEALALGVMVKVAPSVWFVVRETPL